MAHGIIRGAEFFRRENQKKGNVIMMSSLFIIAAAVTVNFDKEIGKSR